MIKTSKDLNFTRKPLIMGVLNVTPDSFSGDGITDIDLAVERGIEMVANGADLIDIGGESSRPNAPAITTSEELSRVLPVIERLSGQIQIPISIDTYHYETAAEAIKAGASIINDISGLRDRSMIELAARTSVYIVIMHMRGNPATMQSNPKYEDVTGEVLSFLSERSQLAVNSGINPSRIIVDPGIGFGKLLNHNLQLLHDLNRFKLLQFPVLIGISRKSFIGQILSADVHDRLEGTLAAVAYSVMQGVDIVRVHDVKSVNRFLCLLNAIVDPTKVSVS
jgi:dihydropteroate synthase